jgi:ribosomal 50S subunit-recycling heat shock protein
MYIKYIGRESTRVMIDGKPPKITVKPGQVFKTDDELGLRLVKGYDVYTIAAKLEDQKSKPKIKKSKPKKETQEAKKTETNKRPPASPFK